MRELLGIPHFRRLWFGQTVSDFGDGLTNLALLLLVSRLTGSTAALATMAVALAVPQLTVGLLAGVYVDRWDRRRIMLASDAVRAALVLGFVFVRSSDQLWVLYLLAFAQSAVGTFFRPARGALVATIVPQPSLMAANSLTETSKLVAGLAGTAAAGLLAGWFHTMGPAFVVDAATFAVSFLAVRSVSMPAEAAPVGTRAGVGAAFRDGLSIVRRSPVLIATFTGVAVLMLGMGAVNVLFVPLVTVDLGVAPTWFGAIELAQVVSMVLSGALVASVFRRVQPTAIVPIGLVGTGVLVMTLSRVDAVWQLVLLMFLVGWLITPLQAAVTTLAQTSVDSSERGRVLAFLSAVSSVGSIVSMAAAGLLADVIGVRAVFTTAGALAVAAAALAALLYRRAAKSPAARESTGSMPIEGAVVLSSTA